MLHLDFGETEVNVHTTSTLSRLLAATHRPHAVRPERSRAGAPTKRTVTVEIPPPSCAPEHALRGAQREIAAEIAAHHGWYAVKMVVVGRAGRALALLGAPGSGKSTIAAHLISRGWQLVTDDIAFIDAGCASVVAHQNLMTFGSGAIQHLPPAFRVLLERSRWFVDEHGELQFYEVDPAGSFGAEAWSSHAELEAVVVVDEGIGTHGVDAIGAHDVGLTAIDGRVVPLDAIAGLHLGVIRKQSARQTTDFIERWYQAHAYP
jgi:hypothetical protein